MHKVSETPLITVKQLFKQFTVAQREEGLKGAIGYLFSRKQRLVNAVNNVSFEILPGEMVGYIGRNGAGKSTTIKMLTGILVPTSGSIEVDGIVPYKKRAENGQKIGVVFGQRTQLRWDILAIETFRLLREVYQIPRDIYANNIGLFSEILELDELLSVPVRKLSLGQRMKCDLAASLLHNPKIVYLDEPTIGLDIVVKEKVREFVKTINRERNTTVILTTHDLSDIEDLCRRVIVIDRGRVVFDGSLDDIKVTFDQYKVLTFDIKEKLSAAPSLPVLPQGMDVQNLDTHRVKVRVDRKVLTVADATRALMEAYEVLDMRIEEPGIEAVVKKLYQEGGWHATHE